MQLRSIIFLLLTLFPVSLLWMGCSKANEKELAANSPATPVTPPACDTVNMQYAAHIQPILQANCTRCHRSGNSSGGVSLDNYASVKGQVNNGSLTGTITHAAGYDPMPQGAAKLSDCTINKIKDWIARGAQNN